MNCQNDLPLRPRDALPTFTPINKPPKPHHPQPTTASQAPTNPKPPKLHSQIFAKLSLVDPNIKANIVTPNTDGEWYAHVLDQSNKVRYSSMGQQSVKIALKVVLALVEQDLSGLVQEEEVEVEDSEEENEVDYEMEDD